MIDTGSQSSQGHRVERRLVSATTVVDAQLRSLLLIGAASFALNVFIDYKRRRKPMADSGGGDDVAKSSLIRMQSVSKQHESWWSSCFSSTRTPMAVKRLSLTIDRGECIGEDQWGGAALLLENSAVEGYFGTSKGGQYRFAIFAALYGAEGPAMPESREKSQQRAW